MTCLGLVARFAADNVTIHRNRSFQICCIGIFAGYCIYSFCVSYISALGEQLGGKSADFFGSFLLQTTWNWCLSHAYGLLGGGTSPPAGKVFQAESYGFGSGSNGAGKGDMGDAVTSTAVLLASTGLQKAAGQAAKMGLRKAAMWGAAASCGSGSVALVFIANSLA